jgi:hypothetical protein
MMLHRNSAVKNRKRRPSRLDVERLEGRTLLSVLTVNTLTDDPSGPTDTSVLTLRDAVTLVDHGGDSTSLGQSGTPAAWAAQIDSSSNGGWGTNDTIQFAPDLFGSSQQTITLGGSELLLSSNVTLTGPGAGQLAISGNSQSRVFEVADGTTATISGLTIEYGSVGGYLIGGGAIYNLGTLSVSDCTLTGNSAGSYFGIGGAIYNLGTLSVSDCTLTGNSNGLYSGIRGNYYGGMGGAIYNLGTLTVSDCTLTGNSAGSNGSNGGAIYNGGTSMVSGCTLSSNSATGQGNGQGGGAIYNGGTLTVSDCTVTGNSTGRDGGAILNYGTLTAIGCTLTDNSATEGGAIANDYGILTVSGCTLTGNSAPSYGGAIYNYNSGTLTVSGCTLTDNSAGFGGAVHNEGTLTVSGCTLMDNSAGFGGAIWNVGTLTVSGCALSGNSAGSLGGAVANGGTLAISGCILTGNSAAWYGGGIYNYPQASLIIEGAAAADVFGNAVPPQTPDINSTVSGNQAPTGADIENVGSLSVNHATVGIIDDQNPAATSTNVAAADTATNLTPSVNPSGQIVLNVQVLAAQAGAGTPSGSVTLYDGNNNPLSVQQSLVSGQATITDPSILDSPAPNQAVYTNDGMTPFDGSTSAALIQTVDALAPGNLQRIVDSLAASPATAIELQANDDASWQAALGAINAVSTSTPLRDGVPVTVVLNVAPGTYTPVTYSNTDPNVTFILHGSTVPGGTIVDPDVPALTITSGNVIVTNVTFTESGDAPTILVTGGHLTLRNDIVQESTGSSDPAIAVSGGSTLDLGTAGSPGGNTININGAGQVLVSSGLNVVTAVGNTFQVNGAAITPVAIIALTSSANPSLPNQPVTFTATVSAPTTASPTPSGSVTFVDRTIGATLGTVSLSGGTAQWSVPTPALGTHTILAVYSGDAQYITSTATLAQTVHYRFSGFLAPLSANLSFALNRVVPIKFQLVDYNGYVSSLAPILSLQVLNTQGTNVLTNAGSTALRYDPMTNQFVANWQTKGLAAGSYQVVLKLADVTTQTKTIQLKAGGGAAGLMADTSSTSAATTSGALLGGDLTIAVNDPNGLLSADQQARISDAISRIDVIVAPYGVTITQIDPTSGPADVTIDTSSTSAVGGYAEGVLGCESGTEVTVIQGWNWYAAADPTAIQAGQFDFETVVMHELGHVLGLGHSANATSVMYATLAPGMANRNLTAADLNVPDTDGGGGSGLHARVPRLLPPAPTAAATAPLSLNQNFGLMAWDAAVADLFSAGLTRTARKRT